MLQGWFWAGHCARCGTCAGLHRSAAPLAESPHLHQAAQAFSVSGQWGLKDVFCRFHDVDVSISARRFLLGIDVMGSGAGWWLMTISCPSFYSMTVSGAGTWLFVSQRQQFVWLSCWRTSLLFFLRLRLRLQLRLRGTVADVLMKWLCLPLAPWEHDASSDPE